MAIAASAVVIVALVVLVIVKVTGGTSTPSSARTPVSGANLGVLQAVPVSTLVAAAGAAPGGSINAPTDLPPTVPPLTNGAKPAILYIGAEFCPFCAAERWPIVMALSKFGTFQNLTSTTSSSTDTNPNTPTFSFYGSGYTSAYLTFTAVELEDRNGKPLQTPTAAQSALVATYDAPPYTKGARGSIPFVDLGGKFLISGTEYDGSALSGMSFNSAVSYLTSANNSTSRAAEAVTGHLVGTICALTHNQPAQVCSAVPASLKTGQASAANQGASTGG
jgi:hypothetical protein